MGTALGKPFAGLFQETEPRIVFFGLPGTGKSSILHKLKTGEVLSTNMPTVGLDMESFKYKNSSFCFVEMGGQYRYKIQIQGNVPDNVAVLVYANKHEVPGAMTAYEISNELDLASLRLKNWQRNWHVQSSCALSDDGLHEGLDWLLKNAERM
ncbi:hypothetical protein F2Q69_00063899 [Brassica cretica]|uniref:Uncharacterized protein n=1 Tax=Brassica cretica TaxID=69181 RepID=A0A8S9RJV6_BRACR|nr:hypothetical protein F2Q69_00063899 [Brassica cretica]